MKRISSIFLFFILSACNGVDTESIIGSKQRKPNSADRLIPKCSDLCPNSEQVLKGNSGFWNFLSFENFGYRGIGRCRGHAIVSQKFAELAEFEPGPLCRDPESSSCLLHLKLGVAKILNFEVFIFQGFSSVYELTKHPYVKERLISEVRNTSHRYNAVQADIEDDSYATSELSNFYEIIFRLKQRQQPYIGIKGTALGNHALLAYDHKFEDGIEFICVRDSNILPHEVGESCQNKLFIKDNDIYYYRESISKS